MMYLHLFQLMDDCSLSYEQLGERLGVSGMTLRRWRHNEPRDEVPRVYQAALVEVIYQLIIEGSLAPSAPVVQAMLDRNANLSIGAALKNLGLSTSDLPASGSGEDRMIEALASIGTDGGRKTQIDRSSGLLNYFQKLGLDWKDKIVTLRDVITSTQLTALDKVVAYGALFYLITPFDLVPDYVPILGLIDDYGILAMAVAYYARAAKKNAPSCESRDLQSPAG